MTKNFDHGSSKAVELSSIVDKMALLATLDDKLCFLEANYNFLNLLGRDLSFLINKDIFSQLSPDTPVEYLESLRRTVLRGFSWQGELEFQTGGKEQMWMELTIVPINDTYKLIGLDITEKKLVKTALFQSLKFQDALMEAAPIGFFLADEAGRCANVNRCWKKMTGLSLLNAAGDGWTTAIHPEDKLEVLKKWRSFVEGSSPFSLEYRYVKKNGEVSYVMASAERVSQQKRQTILRVEYDLTEFKHKEEIIDEQRSKVELNSRLAALGEMAASIGHEINNPLAIISGMTERIKIKIEKHVDQTDIIHNLDKIQKNVERTSKIVKSMQSLVRQSHSDPFQTSSLLEILEDVISLSSSRLSDNNIKLIISPYPSKIMVDCRPGEISQVILNLMVNASDAIAELKDKWIKIDLFEKDSFVEIWVTDSGKGPDAELREKIFRPFFTTKQVGKGTGMGLSISKSIIEAHGGELNLSDGTPNTRFIIKLPKIKP